MTVESKSVVAQAPAQKIYAFLSDFNNYTRLIPSDKVQGWRVEGNRCSFNVSGFMQLTLEFAECTPYSRIVVAPAANASSPMPFRIVVNLSEEGLDATRVSIAFDLDGGNPMMTMMLKPKLKEAADKMVEQFPYFAAGL